MSTYIERVIESRPAPIEVTETHIGNEGYNKIEVDKYLSLIESKAVVYHHIVKWINENRDKLDNTVTIRQVVLKLKEFIEDVETLYTSFEGL